jgi:CubicO group peptidase (beta-lactamase class C family)
LSELQQEIQQAIDELVESGAERGVPAAQMLASLPPDLPMFRSASMSLFPDAAFGNRPDVLAADIPASLGPGYGIGGPDLEDRSATTFGYGGVGGSFACGDPATGVAWAVTKSRVSGDFATATRLGRLIAVAT